MLGRNKKPQDSHEAKNNKINYFTEQFKHGKKPVVPAKEIKKPQEQKPDKSIRIKTWLKHVADAIVANRDGKYDGVYQTAQEACAIKNSEVEIARYRISQETTAMFKLPDLSVKDIAHELTLYPVEVTINKKDNLFYGCILKLKPCYDSQSNLTPPKENASQANGWLETFGFLAVSAVGAALKGKKLDGFKIELDASHPKLELGEDRGQRADDGCRIC